MRVPHVIAITVAFNRKQLTREIIESLKNQTVLIDKFIIIDNSNNDDIKELVSEYESVPFVIEYCKMEQNIGSSKGFHIAVKKAMRHKFDFLWILDDDTIPDRNCLELLLEKAYLLNEMNEKIGFLCSLTYGFDNVAITIPSPSNDVDKKSGYLDCFKYLEFGVVKVSSATFCSLLVRREAIEKVGYPVDCFTLWAEDTEYTMRILKHYGDGYLVGESKAFHKRKNARILTIKNETDPNRIKNYRYFYRNTLIVINEYKNKKDVILEICRNVLLSIKILFSKDQFKYCKVKIIFQGIFMYIFKKYDVDSYKNKRVIK